MNKKSLLGLLLFACLVITALFAGATFLISQGSSSEGSGGYHTEEASLKEGSEKTLGNQTDGEADAQTETEEKLTSGENSTNSTASIQEGTTSSNKEETGTASSAISEEPWLSANPSDIGMNNNQTAEASVSADESKTTETTSDTEDANYSIALSGLQSPQLIIDSEEIDYKSYIPEMVVDSQLETALDITNPSIDVEAEAAILFDAETKEVLYYKNAVQAMFPASTAKLLTSIVALQWCDETEEVTIGDEISMIASDSTRAYLTEGEVLTIRNLLEGMLLPSGNDAAYAMAAYVGRKSLDNPDATKEEAVTEFIRLMNFEAKQLGVKNSCFMTPDGYDAVGQYTTAYDMGLIGIAAAQNATITEVTKQSSSRNIFVSGEDVTWNNTNKLVTKYSGQYYSCAIGLKTGTSSMAGRCMVAAGEQDGKKAVCVIMDSTSAGRWEDAIELLKYGLSQ